MKIKFCGFTNKQNIQDAINLGANALGFIFYEKSPRYNSIERTKELCHNLPPFISRVGVFVDQSLDYILEAVKECKLDTVQLHGNETAEFCATIPLNCIKGIHVKEKDDITHLSQFKNHVSALLLDTKTSDAYGGTGQAFDWGLAIEAKSHNIPIILSGGINLSNIERAIQLVNPYALDLSSGIEDKPGIKSYTKMKEIMERIKPYH